MLYKKLFFVSVLAVFLSSVFVTPSAQGQFSFGCKTIEWLKSGMLIVGCDDGALRYYSTGEGELVGISQILPEPIKNVVISTDEKYVAVAGESVYALASLNLNDGNATVMNLFEVDASYVENDDPLMAFYTTEGTLYFIHNGGGTTGFKAQPLSTNPLPERTISAGVIPQILIVTDLGLLATNGSDSWMLFTQFPETEGEEASFEFMANYSAPADSDESTPLPPVRFIAQNISGTMLALAHVSSEGSLIRFHSINGTFIGEVVIPSNMTAFDWNSTRVAFGAGSDLVVQQWNSGVELLRIETAGQIDDISLVGDELEVAIVSSESGLISIWGIGSEDNTPRLVIEVMP